MTQNNNTTPLDEAELAVKRFAFSFVEALVLAKTLGLNASDEDDRSFFGPDLSYAMLAITNVATGSGDSPGDPGGLTK